MKKVSIIIVMVAHGEANLEPAPFPVRKQGEHFHGLLTWAVGIYARDAQLLCLFVGIFPRNLSVPEISTFLNMGLS